MKNIHYLVRRTNFIKHLFLLLGISILFLIFWVTYEKKREAIEGKFEVNENSNVPKEFNFNINTYSSLLNYMNSLLKIFCGC